MLLEDEMVIRLIFFFGIFIVLSLLEWLYPRRVLQVSKMTRWFNNLSLIFLNSFLVKLFFPIAAVGVATYAQHHQSGIFNLTTWPIEVEILLAVIILDGAIYLQHVLFHAVPLLWRLHRVHHADLDFDVTTGLRFHPIEIFLSLLIKFAVIIAIGASPLAVLIFEVLLNATAMFNHSNLYLPEKLDKFLRWFVVTPDMHRIHHSIENFETNSNFGFNLPYWDYLCGTYRAQPQMLHTKMTIGIDSFRNPNWLYLHKLLILPFIGKIENYVINRREWNKSA
jgi:sterol desaturase/sphingolipid hydroxylase (fatty acid hydroxylase superfamily)